MSPRGISREDAFERILAFQQRFGMPHLYFACHAALPLALTPDLLTHLWYNFQSDRKRRPLHIPWIATADLLLSDLVHPVVNDLFEMDTPLRDLLLERLQSFNQPEIFPYFGLIRLKEISRCLESFVVRQLDSTDPLVKARAEAQKWAAQAYTEPPEAIQALARALRKSILEGETGEQLRLAELVDSLKAALQQEPEFITLEKYAHQRRELVFSPLKSTETARRRPAGAQEPPSIGEIGLPPLYTNLPKPAATPAAPTIQAKLSASPDTVEPGETISVTARLKYTDSQQPVQEAKVIAHLSHGSTVVKEPLDEDPSWPGDYIGTMIVPNKPGDYRLHVAVKVGSQPQVRLKERALVTVVGASKQTARKVPREKPVAVQSIEELRLQVERVKKNTLRLRRELFEFSSSEIDLRLLEELLATEKSLVETEVQLMEALSSDLANGLIYDTGWQGADRLTLGAQTTALEVKIYQRMNPVPTRLLPQLDPNGYPLIEARILNHSNNPRRLLMTSYIEEFTDQAVTTIEAFPDQGYVLYQLPVVQSTIRLDADTTTSATLHVILEDLDSQKVESHTTHTIQMLQSRAFPLSIQDPMTGQFLDLSPYLGSLITPDEPAIRRILRTSLEYLPQKRWIGYQSGPDAVRSQVEAVFTALKVQADITCVNSLVYQTPDEGIQTVHYPRESLERKQADCLDGTLLYSSLLKAAGLNPALVLIPGHVFLAWETGEDTNQWNYLETTLTCTNTFEDACHLGELLATRYKELADSLRDPRMFRLLPVSALSLQKSSSEQHVEEPASQIRVEAFSTSEPESRPSQERFLNIEILSHDPQKPLPERGEIRLALSIDVQVSSVLSSANFENEMLYQDEQSLIDLEVYLTSNDFIIHTQNPQLLRLPLYGRSQNQAIFNIEPRTRQQGQGEVTALILRDRNFVLAAIIKFNIGQGQNAIGSLEVFGRPLSSLLDLPHRDLTVVIKTGDEGYDINLISETLTEAHLNISSLELSQLVKEACEAFRDIIYHRTGNASPYGLGIDISPEFSSQTLQTFARAGWKLYQDIFFGPSAGADARQLGERLHQLSELEHLKIQVIAQDFMLPWNLLYLARDIDSERATPEHFLGFRHIIEQLPLQTRMPIYENRILSEPRLTVSLNIDTSLDNRLGGKVVSEQLAWWDGVKQTGRLEVIERSSAFGFLQAMAVENILDQIMYFYGPATSKQFDENASPGGNLLIFSGGGVTLDDLKIKAPPTSMFTKNPLIFLNICESAEINPLFYSEFMPYFTQKGARGMVGPNCEIPAAFAAEWARRFFQQFLFGEKTIGETFLELRREFFFKHNNILGLAYTLYCDTDTRITPGL